MSVLGKLLYKIYYQPISKQARIKKFGGKVNYRKMLAGEQEMRDYAFNRLKMPTEFSADGKYRLNLLTGDKLIHQSLFCVYSFFKYLSPSEAKNFTVNFYSDGTLGGPDIMFLKEKFATIRIITHAEISKRLKEHLPPDLYPYLNEKVAANPLFKKLIYPHLGQKGSATFLDSDMLFFKRPDEFLYFLNEKGDSKADAFCIQDVQRSYGYSESEITLVWPASVSRNINSGLYSLWSENIDFVFIERLVRAFETRFGSQYYMEQLITAIILERFESLFVAPKLEYIVMPGRDAVRNSIGTLQHYVNDSKEFYFKEAWRKFASK